MVSFISATGTTTIRVPKETIEASNLKKHKVVAGIMIKDNQTYNVVL